MTHHYTGITFPRGWINWLADTQPCPPERDAKEVAQPSKDTAIFMRTTSKTAYSHIRKNVADVVAMDDPGVCRISARSSSGRKNTLQMLPGSVFCCLVGTMLPGIGPSGVMGLMHHGHWTTQQLALYGRHLSWPRFQASNSTLSVLAEWMYQARSPLRITSVHVSCRPWRLTTCWSSCFTSTSCSPSSLSIEDDFCTDFHGSD